MNRRTFILQTAAAFAMSARAADPALVEHLRAGAKPVAAEREVLAALAPKVYELEAEYDSGGHVIKLFLSQHGQHQKEHHIVENRPGVGDADAPLLARLPQLQAICFEMQPVTEKGLPVLNALKHLRDVRFHYMAAGIDPDFATVVNGRDLDVLHIKHNFSAKPDVGKLGAFPNLRYLVLDTTVAKAPCVEFVKKCLRVEVFELHRPTLRPEQFGELCAHLPNVRWFEVKPNIGGCGALQHLKLMPRLECLQLSQWKDGALPFDDGLEHLVPVKTLKHLNVPSGSTPADLDRLRQARPDIQIASRDVKFPPKQAADGTLFGSGTSPIVAVEK